jgi:hypothetical protein
MFNEVPVALKKGRAKAVRARARVILHGEKGGFYFFGGKRGYKRSGLRGAEGGGSNQGREIKNGRSRERGAQKAFEEGVQDGGLGMMGENRVAVTII